MSLKIQAAGVNEFLAIVYGPHSRMSALLEELGCTPEQIDLLRTRRLEALVDGFVRRIAERLAQYQGGERRFQVLARRLGLDGEPPVTLTVLGVELGVSRERIRQIEASTLRRCRFSKQRHYWLEALYTCAAELLHSEGIALPTFAPDRTARVIARMASAPDALAPATSVTQEEPDTPLSLDAPRETIDRLHETVNIIFTTAGDDITDSLLADLLSGSTRTVIVALVGHYKLQFAHGAFVGIERKRLKAMIRDARRAMRHPNVLAARREPASALAADAPDIEEVARLVTEIRTCVGPDLSETMCGHILHGSRGPQVDALVKTYKPPHYGRLRSLGIKCVMELVRGANVRLTAVGAPPAQYVVSALDP